MKTVSTLLLLGSLASTSLAADYSTLRGYCRLSSGAGVPNNGYSRKQGLTLKECQSLCDIQDSCVAYEYQDNRGDNNDVCELHSGMGTRKGSGDRAGSNPHCYVKKGTSKTIAGIVTDSKDHTTLLAAVKAADLVQALSGTTQLTLFAPTNAAFAKLPAATLTSLLKPENKAQLSAILTYHVVQGKVMSTDLKNGMTAKTLNGANIKVAIGGGKVTLNGNVHVTAADIAASNGVVHVVDGVLLPQDKPSKTIAEIVGTSPNHKTLFTAVKAAGLAEALSDDNAHLTVFAPTDAAFAKLPAGTVETLLKDPKGELAQILKYHVVQGKVMSSQLKNNMNVKTLNGATIKVSIRGGKVYLNEKVQVIAADLEASNGVVHVIDTVLNPPVNNGCELNSLCPKDTYSRTGKSFGRASSCDNSCDIFKRWGCDASCDRNCNDNKGCRKCAAGKYAPPGSKTCEGGDDGGVVVVNGRRL